MKKRYDDIIDSIVPDKQLGFVPKVAASNPEVDRFVEFLNKADGQITVMAYDLGEFIEDGTMSKLDGAAKMLSECAAEIEGNNSSRYSARRKIAMTRKNAQNVIKVDHNSFDNFSMTARAKTPDGRDIKVRGTYAMGPELTMYNVTDEEWINHGNWEWDFDGVPRVGRMAKIALTRGDEISWEDPNRNGERFHGTVEEVAGSNGPILMVKEDQTGETVEVLTKWIKTWPGGAMDETWASRKIAVDDVKICPQCGEEMINLGLKDDDEGDQDMYGRTADWECPDCGYSE
ncbi:hypothetical protein KKH23_07730 [Patescibacteria group bacterium]|nr:hypothetical protein [Patescibacteria group bacterium]